MGSEGHVVVKGLPSQSRVMTKTKADPLTLRAVTVLVTTYISLFRLTLGWRRESKGQALQFDIKRSRKKGRKQNSARLRSGRRRPTTCVNTTKCARNKTANSFRPSATRSQLLREQAETNSRRPSPYANARAPRPRAVRGVRRAFRHFARRKVVHSFAPAGRVMAQKWARPCPRRKP
ncbi:hypothetical protein EVAR_32740_1 [Eumeta japonica]|uniref:Uncharacterized protein n=1 Tax=Eumeta variegata TaxID=151549 RepID=A0A4C1XNK2_EUMVA|nr:hypothetical protein EVAR_32740_1 [Eumeta japonica]